MRINNAIVILALVVFLSGCATTRHVTFGQLGPQPKIKTAALIPQEGNSPEMDSYMQQQLLSYGITLKRPLPAGTRQSQDVDAIVAYSDVWSWDVLMYLNSLTITLFHGPTGNIIVTGRWDNSVFHGFQNPRDVIKELLDDIFSKLVVSKQDKMSANHAIHTDPRSAGR
jgi:hypothetical protein